MRKLVAIENVTLDGIVDSQEGFGYEWTARAYTEEVDRFGNEHTRADVDMAAYGRATYQGMQAYWEPMLANPAASPSERMHAEWVNAVPKVVFSTTLDSADWNNSRLIGQNAFEEVETLKASPGGTIAIYASPRLVQGFVEQGLIDEFRILIHPVTLGQGRPLLNDGAKLDLRLLESKPFQSGAVYMRYEVL